MSEPLTSADICTATIEIVSPAATVDADMTATVQRLLATPREALEHGATFTGRPATWLYRDATHVVKVRSEYRFAARDARRWIAQRAALEQQLCVHHPEKTWILLHLPEVALIASVTPLLRPLHRLVDDASDEVRCQYLAQMLSRYLQVAATHQRRLDEGLSNFALGPDDTLYYVDDDVYDWDTFLSFAQALGFWLRAFPWLTGDTAAHVGSLVRHALIQHFHGRHPVAVVAGQLRRVHLANAEQKQRRETLLQGLEQAPPARVGAQRTGRQTPIALLADIHANAPALQAVLAKLDALGVQQAVVLGDTVGYGPHPREAIQLIRERNFLVIQGNHDYAVANAQYNHGFSKDAQYVARWTHEYLTPEERAWLNDLPLTLSHDEWMAVHGAPQDVQFFYGYVYEMTYEANLEYLATYDIPRCFHGHSHIAGVYYRTKHGLTGHRQAARQDLRAYSHCLVNPGAVGQPRERQGSAARFAVFTPHDKGLTFYRVPYEVEATVRDMHAYDFPASLCNRLQDGY